MFQSTHDLAVVGSSVVEDPTFLFLRFVPSTTLWTVRFYVKPYITVKKELTSAYNASFWPAQFSANTDVKSSTFKSARQTRNRTSTSIMLPAHAFGDEDIMERSYAAHMSDNITKNIDSASPMRSFRTVLRPSIHPFAACRPGRPPCTC